MDLREYEQSKFEIAEILRSTSNLVPHEDAVLHDRVRDLFVRLAEDRFNLVVVGRFNRGKTSIMNSILGSSRLPVGIIPLTSVITTVSYGTTEQVVLRFNKSSLTTDISIDALPQYVTQEGNPGNIRGIKMAEVKLRAEILRRGFYFVDTPGLGSAIVENTLTTQAFLPEADAFLLVTSYESPLTEEEMRFLRSASSSARRLFVAINKHDTVTAEQRETILGYVRDQLHAIFGETSPRLFSVSASEGLDAKLTRDIPRLSISGIPALEEALIGFLLTEKNGQFLQQMCRRTAEVIRILSPGAAAMSATTQINGLLERLTCPDLTTAGAPLAREQAEPLNLKQLQPCEVCSQVNDALWDFECKFQHDISVNEHRRKHFVAAGGLCSFHTWQYHSIASPYGICTAYPDLLDHLAQSLRVAAGTRQQDGSHKDFWPPIAAPGRCILCDIRAKAESEALSRLASRLSRQGAGGLSSLSAICIPHLAMLSGVLQTHPDLVRRLADHQATLLERVAEDMRRFTLKQDATRRSLHNKEEETAAQRALLLVAGHRNVTAGSPCSTTDRLDKGGEKVDMPDAL